MSKKRFRLNLHESTALGLKHSVGSDGRNNKHNLTESQQETLQKIREFQNTDFKEVKRTIDANGLVISKIEKLSPKDLIEIPQNHQIKRVSTNVSTQQQWVITEPIKEVNEAKEIDFAAIFKDLVEPIKINTKKINQTAIFDRLVITDVHIGMEVNESGTALYYGKWDEAELFDRLQIVVNQVVQNQKSNTLIIHELGDYMDGWNAKTTRGGHELPQNMDNQTMFDVGLKFKIALIDNLINHYKKIEFVNICNDNHAGSFGYIVNSAFKTYIELKYNSIVVCNQKQFISHYRNENYCFILTHGKDDKSLKFGFKPILDTMQIEKIKNYIDENKLYDCNIEFSKGDSHQLMFDLTSSTSFEYQNFGAFSPPSEWVKNNFKNTLSCFTFFNYFTESKSIHNYIFKKQCQYSS